MRFLKGQSGQSIVEWLVGAVLVIAVVGSVIFALANTTATEGGKTDTWVNAIPDPH